MNRFAPKALAVSLAAAFTLAAVTPSFAQDTRAENNHMVTHEDLNRAIGELPQNYEPDFKGQETLPATFQRAVQGCTMDGYIYRLPYNLNINFEELGAPSAQETPQDRKSLFGRVVQPAPETILGVVGTPEFMDTLKTMTGKIHEDMQSIAGHLIDEANAAFIKRPIFNELVALAVRDVEQKFHQTYGVTLSIKTEQAKEQGGRCAAATSPEISAPPIAPSSNP